MNIRAAVLAALASVPQIACHDTTACEPDTRDFSIDESLSPEQLDQIVATFDLADREAITCEMACQAVYDALEVTEMESCGLSLPSESDGSGHVTCTGMGVEQDMCIYTEGRRPLGHVETGDDRCGSPLGRSLAAMAYLEAASIDAFEQLVDALVDWGAPEQLVERCRAAADDERHHARWLTALATAHGGRVPRPTRTDVPMTLLAFAEHNAREGCVHETFAALMAHVRARRAPDSRLRQVFARVAADEARHAQLAWDLDVWLRNQLDADAAARVEAARVGALAQLPARARALARLPAELGPLDEREAERLAEELRTRLAA